MQLHHIFFSEIKHDILFDNFPEVSIAFGCKYLYFKNNLSQLNL